MDIKTIPVQELSETHIRHWLRFLDRNPSLDSPYFRPEFVQAAGRVRPNSEVAVLSEGGAIIGFFPFERRSAAYGRPICGRLSDFQAIICAPAVRFDPVELLQGCGLSVWDFDHLIVSQTEFAPFRQFVDGSPYIDLVDGFDRYLARRKELGNKELKQTQRTARKLTREIGELRLVDYEPGEAAHEELFEKTIAWKSDQYSRTRVTNVFSFPWTMDLMRDLLSRTDRAFRGRLTALYSGEHVVATHLGMESNGVLHYWFPTYDPAYRIYSPGRVLMLEICRHSQQLGVSRIDLGRGMATFKTRAMTGVAQVGVGSVDLRYWQRTLRRTFQSTREWVKQSPLRYPARAPARVLYQIKEWMEFH